MADDSRQHQLVLFDIDGTLIFTGGAGGRAFSRAFTDVCHVENGFDGIPLRGRTDAVILADALAKSGIEQSRELIDRFRSTYIQRLSEELARLPVSSCVLPGVVELLGALARRPRTTTALLTGNYPATAKLKLDHSRLWGWFGTGAFGDDAPDRNGLVAVALARARERGMPDLPPSAVVVVGDTPLDVACGRVNGTRTLAVATGGYDVATLEAAGPDAALQDLSDTGSVLACFDRWARESASARG
ncbi:MAG TPA: HAD family hydrolase [Vicinamibacterales bacterium]|jgi:phosphoglycolate phosphatase-like HAD superfamily hydrolase